MPGMRAERELRPQMDTPATHGSLPATPIVPAQSLASRALLLVIAIMSFLCCLTLGALSMVDRASREWQGDLARTLTIQLRPVDSVSMPRELERAVELVRVLPGVASARAIPEAETRALLAPWIGHGIDLDILPISRLVEIEVDDTERLDRTALRMLISENLRGASLDDHSLWTERLAAMANTVVFGGILILGLMLSAMAISVVFATRAAMAANRHVVEVLHFVGAEISFIAGEFQRHFLLLGLKGGAIGGAAAVLLFLSGQIFIWRGRGAASADQAAALLGNASIGPFGYFGVIGIVFVVAVLTAVTSRLAVKHFLLRLP